MNRRRYGLRDETKMNKNLPLGTIIGVIAVVVIAVFGIFMLSGRSESVGNRTPKERELLQALEKVGNNPDKLDPEMKKAYDDILAKNPLSTRNRAGLGKDQESSNRSSNRAPQTSASH